MAALEEIIGLELERIEGYVEKTDELRFKAESFGQRAESLLRSQKKAMADAERRTSNREKMEYDLSEMRKLQERMEAIGGIVADPSSDETARREALQESGKVMEAFFEHQKSIRAYYYGKRS